MRVLLCASTHQYVSALSEDKVLELSKQFDAVVNEFERIDSADNFARQYWCHIAARDENYIAELKKIFSSQYFFAAEIAADTYSWQEGRVGLWIRGSAKQASEELTRHGIGFFWHAGSSGHPS